MRFEDKIKCKKSLETTHTHQPAKTIGLGVRKYYQPQIQILGEKKLAPRPNISSFFLSLSLFPKQNSVTTSYTVLT